MACSEYISRGRNRNCFIIALVVGIAAVVLVVVLTAGLLSNKDKSQTNGAVGNCLPGVGNNETECSKRQCNWNVRYDGGPNCTFPDSYGYAPNGSIRTHDLGLTARLSRSNYPTLFGNDVTNLVVNVTYETSHRLRIKIYDEDSSRYEVPAEALDIQPDRKFSGADRLYDVTVQENPQFGLKVTRRGSGAVVFDTTMPGLVFSDQYLQLTTGLPSDNVYGFGEHNHRRFRHDMNWKKWTIFTRDVAPVDEWNLYGAQTFYMNVEDDGNANGVFLLNSDAMDVTLQPKPYPGITYHVIGGILDFYVFLGPTPENVVQQYTLAVGRPLMPPYWSLGFQLSRWDYHNLTHVKEIVERNRAAGIPQDVQYGDIDYMESKLDFTYDKNLYNGLPQFVKDLHDKGQKYIIILDHAIGSNETIFAMQLNGSYPPYQDGKVSDIFIRDPRDNSKLLLGEVWPGISVYPDFTRGQSVTDWWTRHCQQFWNNTAAGGQDIQYDALWIDMNEPSNFAVGSTTGCENNKYNYPPYVPNILGAGDDGKMFDKTICMDAAQGWGRHYDVHSLYGHSMAITTFNTLRRLFPEKRPLVLTRSNFAGTQKYASHWLGDNQSQWRQIPWSIVGMLEYSLFGFSYTGADICGFWFATTEQMCQRWMLLGAFYPYSRNHNAATWPDQDPAAFSDEMIESSRNILLTRYKFLPFLYTLLHEAHIYGSTVVRPLLHEFPQDKTALSIDRQFLWGPSLLISPVMEENVTEVEAYFPSGSWFDYNEGGSYFKSSGKYFKLPAPLNRIPLHVRGGHIIPWQEPANTTFYSRRNPMGLLVTLDPTSVSSSSSKGNLFWDDGESFETFQKDRYLHLLFEANTTMLKILVEHNTFPSADSLQFKTIDLWGLDRNIDQLIVDGETSAASHIVYNSTTKNVQLIDLSLRITLNHTISWQPVAV